VPVRVPRGFGGCGQHPGGNVTVGLTPGGPERVAQLDPVPGPAERAVADLQAIKGIGPFYSSLIVIRGTGFTDVLPDSEPKALALTARLYHLDAPPSPDRFRELAEAWKPFRTWAVVLIRAAARRILDDAPAAPDRRPAQAGR